METLKIKPINMKFDVALLKRADDFAASQPRTTRTDVFHAAVKEYLDRQEQQKPGKPQKPAK